MSITLDRVDVYFIITLILLILQVYQRYQIMQHRNELIKIWSQINTVVAVVSAKLISLEKDMQSKVGEKESK